MPGTELDFSFNMEGIDRVALLGEAAQRFNDLSGFLGFRMMGQRRDARSAAGSRIPAGPCRICCFPRRIQNYGRGLPVRWPTRSSSIHAVD